MSSSVVLALGCSISVGLGLGVYWIERKGSQAKEVVLGFIVGLLGVLITGLLAHEVQTQETLRGAVPIIQESSLRLMVADVAALDREISDSNLDEVFFSAFFEPVRQSLSRKIVDARGGRVVVESKEAIVILASRLIPLAKRQILVTSYIDPDEWWTASIGGQYEEIVRAAAKVIRFERVFIVDSLVERDRLVPVMQRQIADGIEVRWVLSEELEPQLRRDFLVIDDVVAGELVLAEGRRFREGEFYLSGTIADDYTARFNRIRVSAAEVGAAAGGANP